jgi:perosamine synthetase
MKKSDLAIFGGKPVREINFPAYSVIGDEERKAVNGVLDSGMLSKYLGCWDPDFYGGHQVQSLEAEWADYFNVKHAICINSATSGLIAAAGACDLGPGDEVIVTPYSMSTSASCVLFYGAVPVFADIEEEYFCLDPDSVESAITPRTKAIVVVDLFGQPYAADRINSIAKKHGIKVIEDAAQAPGAKFNGKFSGTLGDVGVFSLNVHKHIHTGEGGIVVTDDDYIADKVRLIRNHAEAVVEDMGFTNLVNMVGMNLRMTEIEASMARCQLKKLDGLIHDRIKNIEYLSPKIDSLPGIAVAKVRENADHAWYVHSLLYEQRVVGVHRDEFIKAVAAELPETEGREGEGAIFSMGYVKPLYLQPLYQQRIGIGRGGFPFEPYGKNIDYSRGICPVTEELYGNRLVFHEMFRPPMNEEDLDDVWHAFEKVYEHREYLLD